MGELMTQLAGGGPPLLPLTNRQGVVSRFENRPS